MPCSSRNIIEMPPEIHTTQKFDFVKPIIHSQIIIGVGRFRILGRPKFRILGGGKGGGANSQQAHDVVTTSCAHYFFDKSVPDYYISHLKI